MQKYPALKFGFTNVLTFYSATELRALVKKLPITKFVLESDSPWFAINGNPYATPADIHHLANSVAKLKDMSIVDVLEYNIFNCKKLYPLFWANK